MADAHSGQCQCGAVTYRAHGLRDIWFCHCHQCRRLIGHYMAACRTEKAAISATGEISWMPHSRTSELGRCAACGSPLFWRRPDLPTMSVVAGSLDDTHGLEARGHMFVSEKGDYYTIADGLPQFPRGPGEGELH